ncbi:hypothetical protein MTO96_001812 [Rhipicephalus appendiculatus]
MRIYFDKDKIRMTVVVPWNVVTRRHGYFVRSLFDRLDVVIVDSHRTVDSSSFPVTTCQSPVRAVFRARYHGQVGLSSVVDAIASATTERDVLFKVVFSVSLAGVSFTLRHPHLKNGRIGIKAIGPGRPFGHTNFDRHGQLLRRRGDPAAQSQLDALPPRLLTVRGGTHSRSVGGIRRQG